MFFSGPRFSRLPLPVVKVKFKETCFIWSFCQCVSYMLSGCLSCPGKDLSISSTELLKTRYIRGVQVIPESQNGITKVKDMIHLTQTYSLCQNKFLGWSLLKKDLLWRVTGTKTKIINCYMCGGGSFRRKSSFSSFELYWSPSRVFKGRVSAIPSINMYRAWTLATAEDAGGVRLGVQVGPSYLLQMGLHCAKGHVQRRILSMWHAYENK